MRCVPLGGCADSPSPSNAARHPGCDIAGHGSETFGKFDNVCSFHPDSGNLRYTHCHVEV
jgi:hypothetical protein